jgi:putative YhbY family RNA-binding protein
MKPLTPAQRRELRASAHHLDPVVIVGHHGLTPAVQHEIDLALLKHELIKVRVGSDDRDVRTALLEAICDAADCAPVQHLGKVLVLWRPNPELKKKAAPAVDTRPARKATSRRDPAPKTGPRAPVDPVRERRRGEGAASGKGRRGAARFAAGAEAPAPDAPLARRKSTFTPKTKPKSFSAKPNPRSAWEKKKTEASTTKASGQPRRRRAGGA